MRNPFHLWLLFALLSILVPTMLGCAAEDDDDEVADDDSGGQDDDQMADDDNGGDDDDFNLSDPLGPGEVRAGKITAEDELIGGPRARGEIGDYKIYNSRIELIIRSPEHVGVSFTGYAGNIIDADRARPPEEPGQDNLQGLDHIVCLVRGFWAQQVQVLSHGEDGQAIIRVIGEDGGVQFTDALLGSYINLYKKDYKVRIVNDYILDPDSDYITVRTFVQNDGDADRNVAIADLPFWGFDTDTFLPRTGFNVGDLDLLASVRWVGGLNLWGTGVSYALATATSSANLYIPYIYGNVIPSVETLLKVKAHEHNSWERIFIVGDGDTSVIFSALNDFDHNNIYGVLSGTLTLADGGSFDKTRVYIKDHRPEGLNYVGMLLPDREGKFSAQLAPGTYQLVAVGEGRADSSPVTVNIVNEQVTPAALSLDAPGYLDIAITGEDGGPLPCRVGFQNGYWADPNSSIVSLFFSATGTDRIPIQPGDYTVTIARGYEYELIRENVTIVAGADNAQYIMGELARSVDTTGWISTDFHIHGAFSTDSGTRPVERTLQFAAEGLEMPVITEHDYVAPYADYVAEAGVSGWVQVVTGTEISPGIGHFNAWPLTPNPAFPDFYGLPFMLYDEEREVLRNYEFPEMWQMAREDYGARSIQINHPRDWFDYIGYDLSIGLDSADPDRFSTDFDAMEVWNGTGGNTLEYWFSFIDQGLNVTLHGNSDSHNYLPDDLGSPRNLIAVPLGGDDPATAEQQEFIDSDLEHHAQLTSGPVIDFTIADQTIGELVIGLGINQVPIHVTVQAPSWVRVDYLKIYSNHGEVVYEEPIAETTNIVRYDDTITLTADEDAYFVVETGHTTATLGPVTPGARTFAITNPIWVDIDGDGEFDAPGLPESH